MVIPFIKDRGIKWKTQALLQKLKSMMYHLNSGEDIKDKDVETERRKKKERMKD